MAATPTLRKLEYLLAVARDLNYRKAAARLHVDQSTLSRQVKEVEDELGFHVFIRGTRFVVIADEAKPFVMALEQILLSFVTDLEKARNLSRLMARARQPPSL